MTNRLNRHRPLRGGIRIMPYTGESVYGTLTAIARRAYDDAKVLVTNIHVVSTDEYALQGNEYIYQGGTNPANRVAQLYRIYDDVGTELSRSWLPVVEGASRSNIGDLCALRLLPNATGTFDLHHHPDDSDTDPHEKRPIVEGAMDPQAGDVLTIWGANTGFGTVRVDEVGFTQAITYRYGPNLPDKREYRFRDSVKLWRLGDYGQNGDSGAAVVTLDEAGNYRMSCIMFGGIQVRDQDNKALGSRVEYAIPASIAEDALDLTFGIQAPIANIVVPQEVYPGELVDLNGSGSRVREPGGQPLTYQWDQILPEPAVVTPNVTLTNRTQQTASFTAPPGNHRLEFQLTVTDHYGAKAIDKVTVTVQNRDPIANAGDDKTAYRGENVELNGSGSDLDGDTLTYQWEQLGLDELGISAVTPVTINMADQATANFVAPDEIGALSFQLTVTDTRGDSHSDEVQVTVQNRNPIAYAGPNKVITVNNRVTLEGSVSDIDPDDRASVTHIWTQEDENPATVTLSPVAAWPARRTFTPRVEGIYNFTLTATDPYGLEASDEVTVRVVNPSPMAVPGWNQAVPVNAMATLAGSAEDPDAGHAAAMTYTWTRVSGPTTTLSDPNVADPTFTPTAVGDYVFKLTVTDPDDLSDEANVTIHCCSATGTSQWYDTGEPGCHNNALQKHQTQVKDGITEFQWVDDPDNEVWGNWGYTGYARNLVMGNWVDTDPLETTGSGENRRKKQSQTTTFESGQERTSECGNTETRWERKSSVQTRWIDYPETGATPPPPSTWVDTGQTRNRVEGPWSDTDRTQQDPVDDSWEKEQTRTVTWEKEQIDSTGNVTEPQWVPDSEVETQWIPLTPPPPPPPSTWVDTGQTRDRVEGSWMDTGNERENQVLLIMEKEQTRTVTWEKEQIDSTGNVTEPQWVSVSEVETRWIPVTVPPPVTHSYRDITPAVYSGCGPDRTRKQECIRLGHEDTNWRAAAEPLEWDPWTNVGSPVIVYGSWTNVGSPQLISGTCKQRKERSWTRTQRQQSQNQCGGARSQTVTTRGTEFNFDTVSETWGLWSYTGGTDYDDIEDIIYYEQERFSSPCNRRQTQWVTTRPS